MERLSLSSWSYLQPWVLTSRTWTAQEDTLHLIWMPLQGVCWFLCCRQGFSLLRREYGEKEEEESFELRNKDDLTPNGRVNTLHLHRHHATTALHACISLSVVAFLMGGINVLQWRLYKTVLHTRYKHICLHNLQQCQITTLHLLIRIVCVCVRACVSLLASSLYSNVYYTLLPFPNQKLWGHPVSYFCGVS